MTIKEAYTLGVKLAIRHAGMASPEEEKQVMRELENALRDVHSDTPAARKRTKKRKASVFTSESGETRDPKKMRRTIFGK